MERHLLILLAIACSLFASGCLRSAFDLCDDPVPHPECGLADGGDAGDAGEAAGDGGAGPQGDAGE